MIELETPPPDNHIVLVYSPHLNNLEWFPALKAVHHKDGFICWIVYDILRDEDVILSEFEPTAWTPIDAPERFQYLVH